MVGNKQVTRPPSLRVKEGYSNQAFINTDAASLDANRNTVSAGWIKKVAFYVAPPLLNIRRFFRLDVRSF